MNRYIMAMEIGTANEVKGISYFELKEQLENKLKFKFVIESELTFLTWFVENFSRNEKKILMVELPYYRQVLELQNGKKVKGFQFDKASSLQKSLSDKHWLNGMASKQYLDYLELKESRIASTQARKQSNISIWIAIGAIVISTGLGAYSIISSPKLPYDVNIIEDKTKNIKLEKENKKLQEKLYKAEMLIKVLEEKDSLNVG